MADRWEERLGRVSVDPLDSVVAGSFGQWTFTYTAGSYGVDEGLIFGFPLTSDGSSSQIVQGVEHNAFAQQKVNATLEELRGERDTVKDLLPG